MNNPVFVIGCGRSGTTIFGSVLGQHKHVSYLNEPRRIWSKAYPETDIWTSEAATLNGKLELTEKDEKNVNSKLLRMLFNDELSLHSQVLIEKLPINNFRLRFLYKIFPKAKFIHIYRNGLEVAKSIEKLANEGRWYGDNSYKWKKLVEYSAKKKETIGLAALCDNNYYKGLLEWRLSTEAALEFFCGFPECKYFELTYNELIEEPKETVLKVLDFIGLSYDESVEHFVVNELSRRTKKIENVVLSEKEKTIGGKVLLASMEKTFTGSLLSRVTVDHDNEKNLE